jgi:xanthine dehydrogenase accessory factor
MAVGADGELIGSIGGGVMEVSLVEESRRRLSVPPAIAGGFREQVHQENSTNASGMICSGKQTVILFRLSARARNSGCSNPRLYYPRSNNTDRD